MPKPITWHGLTAPYHRHERHTMRQLARTYPDEARVIHEFKALLGATLRADASPPTHVYVWGNNPRRAQLKGRKCVVEVHGRRMNTVLIRFVDTGEKVTTSRHAIKPI